jgi:hypothetical protein
VINAHPTKEEVMNRTLFGLAVAVTLTVSMVAARAAEKPAKPDATIELKEGSVAAGIGFSWGGGTLTYKGKKHKVSVDGLSVGSVGITEATAAGKVYGLTDLSKFDGLYTAVAAGATAAGGANVTAMKNQNGVRIDLVSTTQGVDLKLAAEGVHLKLKK